MGQTSEQCADVVLLNRIVARDSSALAEFYDRQSPMIFSLLLRILRDRREAEEVLQEVFLAVWTRADSYNVTLGSPAGWLVGIARNRGIDRLRANTVRDRTVDTYLPADNADSPELRAARSEQARVISRALDALQPEQRDLIEHAFFLGLTHSELAARFGLPLGTVKTRIRAGMLALRQRLQENFIES
jgi:RNA polymerase sigma-70 factor (ECF subfamily)